MGPECYRAAASDRFYVCQFRASERFQDVEVPSWANTIADRIAEGSRVRIGHIGSAPVVESVLILRDQADDPEDAATIAERIAERVEQ